MKQYKFQNNYGVIARKKVCSCAPICSSFPIDPQIFSRGANFTKNYHFWRFLEPYGHIFKATTVKFGMLVWSWDSLLQVKLCKNHLRGYTPLGQIYTKNYHFWRFFGP